MFRHHRGFGVRYLILALLKKKPMSAIEIIQELEHTTLGYWHPSPGVIYWNLNVLLEEGLIRKVNNKYEITKEGMAQLDEIWMPFSLLSTDDQISSVINMLEDIVDTINAKKSELNSEQKKRIEQAIEKLKNL